MSDPHRLERFVEAQAPVFADVVAELTAGRKASHWMWFVFPQLRGLGRSPTARHYGLASLDEAEAYLRHPLLGARLRQCTDCVLAVPDRSAHAVFGAPDDLKFHSSMTLFAQVPPEEPRFGAALDRYFQGEPDPLTLRMLGRS